MPVAAPCGSALVLTDDDWRHILNANLFAFKQPSVVR